MRRGVFPSGDVIAAISSWDLSHGRLVEVGGLDRVWTAAHAAVGLAVGHLIKWLGEVGAKSSLTEHLLRVLGWA